MNPASTTTSIINLSAYSPRFKGKPIYILQCIDTSGAVFHNNYARKRGYKAGPAMTSTMVQPGKLYLGQNWIAKPHGRHHAKNNYSVYTEKKQHRIINKNRFKIIAKLSWKQYTKYGIRFPMEKFHKEQPKERDWVSEILDKRLSYQKSTIGGKIVKLSPVYYIPCGPEPNFQGSIFKDYETALETAERFSEKHKKPIVIYKAYQRVEVKGVVITDYE